MGGLQGAFWLSPQVFVISPEQHFVAPPGLFLHPDPPHSPQFFAQHTEPEEFGIPLYAEQSLKNTIDINV